MDKNVTPTPWKFSPNSFGTQFIYGDLETPLTTPMGVSYFHLVAGGDHPGTLTEANAAFIVKAVNAHEALIEALARIRDFPHDKSTCEQAMSQIAYDAIPAPVGGVVK